MNIENLLLKTDYQELKLCNKIYNLQKQIFRSHNFVYKHKLCNELQQCIQKFENKYSNRTNEIINIKSFFDDYCS